MGAESLDVEVSGRTLKVSNPDKVWFPALGATKRDVVEYFLSVGAGVLGAVVDRPTVLRRFPDGVGGKSFYQKRVPRGTPEWVRTVRIRFPSGRAADELCPVDLAHVVWAVGLGSFELHPWPVHRDDVDRPNLLRVDLDPQEGIGFDPVRGVAVEVRAILDEIGLTGFPKTSGGRGLHVLVPIVPEWGFVDVRRAALALAREVERRLPDVATSKWWKEERGARVLLDYNQNARDRTIVSAYSIRPRPEATVSTPVSWDEIADIDPDLFTLETVPTRFAEIGDLHAGIVDPAHAGRLDGLLRLAAEDEAMGLGDAPWPPNFPKQADEPHRSRPSVSRRHSAVLDAHGATDPPADPAARPRAVVFDVDGVLASAAWRLPLVEGRGVDGRGKDWDAFFAGIPRDAVIPEGRRLFGEARSGHEPVYVTGRPERTRAETEQWLAGHGFPSGPLFMRSDDDRRPEQIVKRDVYESVVETRWDVRWAFEDRWQSAAMWDSFGIRVHLVEDPGLEPESDGPDSPEVE